jgi:phage virion morphogenesis protein
MAGASIQIEIDDREVLAALQRLVDAGRDLKPAFEQIGEYLDLAHRQRWDRQEAPDGTPWAPLSPKTLARKHKKGRPLDTLVESGDLRDLLRYQASDDGLEFGTDRRYGAPHQFGREEAGIPARPFLGLSEDDKAAVLDILQEHLEGGLGG